MKPNPYLIQGPALISFSGGRTSAYMLHEIIRAHGGSLPADVHVTFANTGKERPETLRFVQECGEHWGVRVVWLEWRDGQPGFEIVGPNSCSRNGEPFAALIAKKGYLSNAVTRFCTSELKVRVMKRYALSVGFEHWDNIVGLRHDEGHRVLKRLAANDAGKDRWTTVMPLARALVTKRHVMAFWAQQPFDLGLRDYEGNCDMCFLKSYAKLCRLTRDDAAMPDWWAAQEASITMDSPTATPAGRRFVTEYSYADLARHVREQPLLIDDHLLDEDMDSDCVDDCNLDAEAA